MKILVTVIYSAGLFLGPDPWVVSTTRSAPMHAAACEKFAQNINDLYPLQYAYCIDAKTPNLTTGPEGEE